MMMQKPSIAPTLTSLLTQPDRLAANPRSPPPVAESFEHESGIGVNGKARTNVEEHCIREGWVTIPSPKARECYGNPMQIAVKGTVGAFYA
ncbi:DUF3297 family protein [Aeromonas bivalvium]|uniref:DUF3297 family protein n=1 Tax=Aeromonas bivalvium TaxID=440079 RepID=UPI00370C7B71